MKILLIIFFILSLHPVIIAQNNHAHESASDSVSTVFNLQLREWMAAYNGGNANELIPLYSEDAQYISSHVDGLVTQGRDQLIANFQNGMNMGGHIDRIDILSINSSCDLATLVCRYEATNNGQKAIGRNLLVLKRMNNRWCIIIHMTVV